MPGRHRRHRLEDRERLWLSFIATDLMHLSGIGDVFDLVEHTRRRRDLTGPSRRVTMVRPHVAGYEPAMAVRDQTRLDRITSAFRRGMSTEEVGKAFGISAVRVSQILRDSDVRLGRERRASHSNQLTPRPGSD